MAKNQEKEHDLNMMEEVMMKKKSEQIQDKIHNEQLAYLECQAKNQEKEHDLNMMEEVMMMKKSEQIQDKIHNEQLVYLEC